MIHVIPRKNPQEFFKIPSNESNEKELAQLQKIINQKLSQLLGLKIEEETKQIEVETPKEIQKPQTITPHVEIKQPRKQEINDDKKIFKAGIKKEPGYLYFVDEEGDISRVKMARGKSKKEEKPKKVSKTKKVSEHDQKSKISDKKVKQTNEEVQENTNVTLDDISNLLLGGRK